MMSVTDVQSLEAQHVLQVYRRAGVVFDRGEGVRLIDASGRRYLDFISGVGVSALGHAHPGLAAALAHQASTLVHTSNLYFHPLQGELATRLSDLTGLDRAFFCNSGAEAVETCLKFARKYWHGTGAPRTNYVAFTHSFHGRTMGALSVTWDEHYRAPFQPLVPDVVFADAADPSALDALVDDRTAAIIIEPVQGEGGVRPISPALAEAIQAARARTGALLIADEIQCGCGRTGTFTYGETLGLAPDLMPLGKSLGAGVPIAAALFSNRVAEAAAPGDHGSTYGGNLLACRAALYFLGELVDRGLMASVARVSRYLRDRLEHMAKRHAVVNDVRGAGLMLGVDLKIDAAPVIAAALDRGLLVNRTSTTVVRLLPPYVITDADVDEAVEILDQAIGAA